MPNERSSLSPSRLAALLAVLGILAIMAGFAFQQVVIPSVLDKAAASRITPTLLQTLDVRLWTAYGTGIALLAAALMAWIGGIGRMRAAVWMGLGIGLAALLRVATPEIAFNSIVRPDGVHFSVVAQRIVTEGKLTVPTGDAELPSRTLPGQSFIQALTQWTQTDHPGQGIHAVGLFAFATLVVAAWTARRISGGPAAWWAVSLIAFSPLHAWYSRQLMSEIPWGFSVLLACSLIALGRGKPTTLLSAGLISGIGLTFKSSHLLMVIATLLGAAVALPGKPRLKLRMTLILLAGMAIGAAPAFYYNHAALGGWLSTAYHVYWPGWASATEALNVKYLWEAPLIKGSMGNIPYYALAMLGLDPRPERMPLLPGVLLAAGWLLVRHARRPASEPDAYAIFMRMAAWVGVIYGAGCFLYSFQDPRFLLPMFPLLFTAAALRISRTIGPMPDRWASAGALVLFCSMTGLGIAIVKAEAFGHRIPERVILQELARTAEDYDVIVSDEDPVLLTVFGVWSENTRVYPLLLQGELWFPENPAAYFAETGLAVKPFEGTVDRVTRALREGQRVACFIRRPHDRPEAWAVFREAFTLEPVGHPHLPWLMDVTLAARTVSTPAPVTAAPTQTVSADAAAAGAIPTEQAAPVFMLGFDMEEPAMARERSLPAHPVSLSPFDLEHAETSAGTFAAFLNDVYALGRLRIEEANPLIEVSWIVSSNVSLPVCLLDTNDVNNALRFDSSNRTYFAETAMAQLPAVQVSWYGAILLANWKSAMDGLDPVYEVNDDATIDSDPRRTGWRLPTEAEWEWTATWDGQHKRRYAWGDEWNPDFANLAESSRHPKADDAPFTIPVDADAPWMRNVPAPVPHRHLTGNVWEWCHDWYGDYTAAPTRDPSGPATGTVKVLRGGSFRSYQRSAWAAFRGVATPETMTPDIGFRLARSIP